MREPDEHATKAASILREDKPLAARTGPPATPPGSHGDVAGVPALLRATAAEWTALAAEQMRTYHLGIGRADNHEQWEKTAHMAAGRAHQLEYCAGVLMAMAADLEDTCNPE